MTELRVLYNSQEFPLLGNSSQLGALRSPCLEPATEQPTAQHDTCHTQYSHRTQAISKNTPPARACVSQQDSEPATQRHSDTATQRHSDTATPCLPHARPLYFAPVSPRF